MCELQLALLALVAAGEPGLHRAQIELRAQEKLSERHAQKELLHHLRLPAERLPEEPPRPRVAAANSFSAGSLEAAYRSMTEQLMNASVMPLHEQFCPSFNFEADVNGGCAHGWNCSGAAQVWKTCAQPMKPWQLCCASRRLHAIKLFSPQQRPFRPQVRIPDLMTTEEQDSCLLQNNWGGKKVLSVCSRLAQSQRENIVSFLVVPAFGSSGWFCISCSRLLPKPGSVSFCQRLHCRQPTECLPSIHIK